MKSKGILNIFLVLVLLVLSISMNLAGLFSIKPAIASGEITFTANITSFNYEKVMQGQSAVANFWSVEVAQSTYDEVSDGVQCGVWGTSQANKYYSLKRSIVGFDLTGLPAGIDITGARIRMKSGSQQQNAEYNPHYAFYKMYNADGVINSGDFDEAYNFAGTAISDRATVGYYQNSIVASTWYDFTVLESDWTWIATPDANDLVWLTFASMHDMTNSQPVPWVQYGITFWNWKDWNTAGCDISLEIDYVQGTPEREVQHDINASTDNTTDGTEVADNVTWESPRAGYADEGVYLKINGESGASIDIELVDQDGTVLTSFEDSVRTDGNYDFYYDLPDSFYGFVRLLENNFNLVSDYGYQMPKPDDDQVSGLVYAVSTEYPQYDYVFRRYLTYENDMFALHWKTNVQAGEEPDHSFRIWGNGDNVTSEYYAHTLEWLNDNYWHANSDNKYLSAWRYIIMTPNIEGSGFDDYDGMVLDMDTNYTNLTAGFLQAVITDDTDNSTLADSHSCYWYIPAELDGLIFNLNKSTYNKATEMVVKVQVGSACRIQTYLPSLKIEVLDDSETVVKTYNETFVYGLNEYLLTAPVQAGNYELRFTFSGDATWSYIHDEPFSVTGKAGLVGAESIVDNIKNWIEDTGLATTTGYWALLLLGMVVLFLLAYKSPIMRVTFPLVYLGLFMIWEFVDTWLIILLALGAGLALYGIFRKKTGGGSPEG